MRITLTSPAEPMIQRAALSDLFFNYDHPERDRLYAPPPEQRSFSEADLREALLLDAASFIQVLEHATGISLAPAELVDDYLARAGAQTGSLYLVLPEDPPVSILIIGKGGLEGHEGGRQMLDHRHRILPPGTIITITA